MLLLKRMLGALLLDSMTFEEVEADRSANLQALFVVLLSALATGLGSASDVWTILLIVIAFVMGWLIWAFMISWIGTRLLPEPQTESDAGELLRTLGFAASPGILGLAGVIPVVGVYMRWLASAWMLVAAIIAVRQALDYRSTARAVLVCAIGWFVHIAVLSALTISAS